MSFFESIFIALFCLIVVFAVLIALWAILRLFSTFIYFIESKRKNIGKDNNSKV